MLKRKHDKIINIMQLRFFCQVALRGSVSRAADDLFRTQSAITRAIRDLEAALNVTLFERHYSGMVPTEYGKCILPRARRAIDDLQAIPALLQKHHTRSSGPLADAGWLFNTRRLAIFIQLYHVNHTQTVAQQLGITQPAVSAALKVWKKERIRRYFAGRQRGCVPRLPRSYSIPGEQSAQRAGKHLERSRCPSRGAGGHRAHWRPAAEPDPATALRHRRLSGPAPGHHPHDQ